METIEHALRYWRLIFELWFMASVCVAAAWAFVRMERLTECDRLDHFDEALEQSADSDECSPTLKAKALKEAV